MPPNLFRGSPPAASPGRATVPAGLRVYAVGDIHGRADLLFDVMQRIDQDTYQRPIPHAIEVYLGDYIDRGPDSKAVIELLAHRLVRRSAICLRGNHESILENVLNGAPTRSELFHWMRLGGADTLASYGITVPAPLPDPAELQQAFRAMVPRTHTLLLECLRDTFSCGDYLFVHAGIKPGRAISDQTQDDLLWIRDEFLDSDADHGQIVVHGHTPVQHLDIRSNRINIDTGAVWTGSLTCIALQASSIVVL
jgi:serine/threonine protein phosphatase 1